jgi:hypothetical protein
MFSGWRPGESSRLIQIQISAIDCQLTALRQARSRRVPEQRGQLASEFDPSVKKVLAHGG